VNNVKAIKIMFLTTKTGEGDSTEQLTLHVRTIFFDEVNQEFRDINRAEFDTYCTSAALSQVQADSLRNRLVFDEHLLTTDSTLVAGSLKNIVAMSKLGNFKELLVFKNYYKVKYFIENRFDPAVSPAANIPPTPSYSMFSMDHVMMWHYRPWFIKLTEAHDTLIMSRTKKIRVESVVEATRRFLVCVKDLFRSVSLHWRIEFLAEHGSECGFTLGALFGLEQRSTSAHNRYMVVQNHMHWFNLVLDYMPKEQIDLIHSMPPLMIIFHALPCILEFKSVIMPGSHFFSSYAILGTVGPKFNYVSEGTALVQITNLVSAPFPERLLKAVAHSLVSGDDFHQAVECLMDELTRIRPIFLLYSTEDIDYIRCYFAAMLASKLDGDYDVEIVKNSIVDSHASSSTSFLVIDYANDRQVCVNLIRQDEVQSVGLDISRMMGREIGHTEPTTLGHDQVLVLNTFYGQRHSPNSRKSQHLDKDYMTYSVSTTKIERHVFRASFHCDLMHPMTLKRDLQNVRTGELALETAIMHLHQFLGTCKQLVHSHQNINALLDGLLHYDAKVKHMHLSIEGSDVVARYVLNMDPQASLSVIVNDETFDLSAQRHLLQDTLKISVSFFRDANGLRLSSHATFGALVPSSYLPADHAWVETFCKH